MDDIVKRNLYVNMERDHLDQIPEYRLPSQYTARWYAPGDEQVWLDIHRQAEVHVEVSLDVYHRVFCGDELSLSQRQCFLFDPQQTPIATATAWYQADFHGRPYGRLHWVAVVSDYQGRGLSKPLLTIVLSRMRQLGHDRVFLRTSTARLPAIELYQKFGFRPSLRSDEDRDIWHQLNRNLRRPFAI